jgi:uncharacterized membrane protein
MLQVLCTTIFAGIVFGLSLLMTEKVLFVSKKPMLIPGITTCKLLLLARFFYIMLKSNQIHPIILVASFLIAYWLTILTIQLYKK